MQSSFVLSSVCVCVRLFVSTMQRLFSWRAPASEEFDAVLFVTAKFEEEQVQHLLLMLMCTCEYVDGL